MTVRDQRDVEFLMLDGSFRSQPARISALKRVPQAHSCREARSRQEARHTPEHLEVPDRLGNRPLHQAVVANKPEAIKALLEAGADAQAINSGQRTPLQLLAKGDIKCLTMLLDQVAWDKKEVREVLEHAETQDHKALMGSCLARAHLDSVVTGPNARRKRALQPS